VPVGSVTTAFATSFESAGINQTRHEISLQASVLMRIIVPTGADSVTVDTLVPIAESIIVGQVPSTYVNVPSDEDALNLVP
ncbi:MAG: sporulation protein YunB, partial [bacterium]|nr:sporulation protein YunB [bacterium]